MRNHLERALVDGDTAIARRAETLIESNVGRGGKAGFLERFKKLKVDPMKMGRPTSSTRGMKMLPVTKVGADKRERLLDDTDNDHV